MPVKEITQYKLGPGHYILCEKEDVNKYKLRTFLRGYEGVPSIVETHRDLPSEVLAEYLELISEKPCSAISEDTLECIDRDPFTDEEKRKTMLLMKTFREPYITSSWNIGRWK